MFFSNTILKDAGMPASQATLLVGITNFLSTAGGMAMLSQFGRRTIMVWGTTSVVIVLTLTGVCQLLGLGVATTVCLLFYILSFELSSGPITWLYMAEIMDDKGTGVASALNWLMNCIIGAVVPYAIAAATDGGRHDERVGWIFIVCAILSFFGLIFILVFMKETRGLTKDQIEAMYSQETESE